VAWTPPGPGFYRVTVLDAEGAATSVAIRVRPVDAAPAAASVVLVPASAPATAP
jgi:hypothetical protein